MKLRAAFDELIEHRPDSALYYARRCYEYGMQHKDSFLFCEGYDKIGIAQTQMSNFQDGLLAFFKALDIRKEQKKQRGILASHSNIAFLYHELGDFEMARVHNKKRLEIAEILGDSNLIISTLFNQAAIAGSGKRYALSIRILRKCLRYRLAKQDTMRLLDVYENMARSFMFLEHYDSASIYLSKALRPHPEGKNDRILASLFEIQGKLLLVNNQSDSGKQVLKKAAKLARIGQDWSTVRRVFEILSNHKQAIGDFEKALTYLQKSEKIRDSIDFNAQDQLTERTKAGYEMARQRAALQEAEQQHALDKLKSRSKTRLIVLCAISILGFVVLIFLYLRQRSKVENVHLYNKLLTAQINPHFVGNALIALQDMILDNKQKESVSYVARLGELMRKYLGASHHMSINLREELEGIKDYLELQKLRFGKRLSYDFTIDTDTADSIQIPTMIVQPLVENAVEHSTGFTEQVHISITLTSNENRHIIQILDNGPGLSKEKAKTHIRKGLSLDIVNSHITQYNKLYKTNVAIHLSNRIEKDNILGTLAQITLSSHSKRNHHA